MREKLFRGKDANGVWVMDSCYRSCGDAVAIAEVIVIPETVGEYIGLRDKNCKRIFEGDIVKCYYFLKDKYYVGVIEYSDELSAYLLSAHKQPEIIFLCSFDKPDVEVIGNIHDNPELLKEKKQ